MTTEKYRELKAELEACSEQLVENRRYEAVVDIQRAIRALQSLWIKDNPSEYEIGGWQGGR